MPTLYGCGVGTRTADLAGWLRRNVTVIASDEAAGQCYAEIRAVVDAIERMINRPIPPRFCGPCTHYVEHNRHCGALLYARREAVEVVCPSCRTIHRIERLTQDLAARADVMRFSGPEILAVMSTLGTPIPARSWSRWRKDGRVKVRGYKRPDNPDGTRGALRLHRLSDDDEPVYRLAEVRQVYRTAIRHSDALAQHTG